MWVGFILADAMLIFSLIMEYPIVQVRTRDHLSLHGLCLHSVNRDVVLINIHGTASNFYEEDFVKTFSEKFTHEGIGLLFTNNRGTGVYDPYQTIGAAVEKFEDCLIDIDAWIEFASDQGYKKIVLSGHSLGAEKVVFYMTRGRHRGRVSSVVLLAPADSPGSHRLHEGRRNPRSTQVEELVAESERLLGEGRGEHFLARDCYGSHEGIMPKSAESFLNFLGSDSSLRFALPFATRHLEDYSSIRVPIFAVIGDQNEYTALPISEALDLMKRENPRTQTLQLKDCDHDFTGKESELADLVAAFIQNSTKG